MQHAITCQQPYKPHRSMFKDCVAGASGQNVSSSRRRRGEQPTYFMKTASPGRTAKISVCKRYIGVARCQRPLQTCFEHMRTCVGAKRPNLTRTLRLCFYNSGLICRKFLAKMQPTNRSSKRSHNQPTDQASEASKTHNRRTQRSSSNMQATPARCNTVDQPTNRPS